MTNLKFASRTAVRSYNERGTTERWTKEGEHAMKITRSSRHKFRFNEVRLRPTVIAYNLGNFWRRLFTGILGRIDGLPLPSG